MVRQWWKVYRPVDISICLEDHPQQKKILEQEMLVRTTLVQHFLNGFPALHCFWKSLMMCGSI
jgi:hypothetical protein